MNLDLEIDCLFYSEEQDILRELNLSTSDKEFEIRKITFYAIDTIYENGDNRNQSTIIVGGESFVSLINYKELKQLIKQNKLEQNGK